MRYLLIGIIVFMAACASTPIPKSLVWEQLYETVAGTEIDSSDLDFQIYIGDSLEFTPYAITPDTSLYLLGDEGLYNDSTYYFFVRSRRISTGTYSEPSDTVSDFFPVLVPSKPYEFKILQILN